MDRIYHSVPAIDGCGDFVWICGPGKGSWVIVGLVEEAVYGGLEVDDGAKDAAFEAALRQLGEEALERVQPRAEGRHKIEHEARMAPALEAQHPCTVRFLLCVHKLVSPWHRTLGYPSRVQTK